jgi:hypothetical protein
MEGKILRRDRLPELVRSLIKDHEVIAPLDERSFGRIKSPEEMYLSDDKPTMSLKEFFFSPREVLVKYQLSDEGVEVETPDSVGNKTPVLFGVRPCDAAALPILDKVFSWDYLDSFYLQARDRTGEIAPLSSLWPARNLATRASVCRWEARLLERMARISS